MARTKTAAERNKRAVCRTCAVWPEQKSTDCGKEPAMPRFEFLSCHALTHVKPGPFQGRQLHGKWFPLPFPLCPEAASIRRAFLFAQQLDGRGLSDCAPESRQRRQVFQQPSHWRGSYSCDREVSLLGLGLLDGPTCVIHMERRQLGCWALILIDRTSRAGWGAGGKAQGDLGK